VRIASLLPAATEIVGALGLDAELVAVTFECDEPAGIRERCAVVVDTVLPAGLDPGAIDAVVRDRAARGLPMYELDAAALARLDPQLILTQDLCRICALPAGTVTDALAVLGCSADVLQLDPHSVADVLNGITEVARRAGRAMAGEQLVTDLRRRLATIERAVAGRPRPRVLVLEWTDPPFLAGHWVPELVRRAGGAPVRGVEGGRSVRATWDELAAEDIDVVVVAPCGYDLGAAVTQSALVGARLPGTPIVAIDSAAFVVRAGPRLVDGIEALAWALHPEAVVSPPDGRVCPL
jgi:iron complex transport system substrate-binding protein